MVRFILVATPAVCLLSSIAVSATLKNFSVSLREKAPVYTSTKITTKQKASAKTGADQPLPFQKEGAFLLLLGSLYLLINFGLHCTWVTSEVYSSSSIVLAARQSNGERVIFDDFREVGTVMPMHQQLLIGGDWGLQLVVYLKLGQLCAPYECLP